MMASVVPRDDEKEIPQYIEGGQQYTTENQRQAIENRDPYKKCGKI